MDMITVLNTIPAIPVDTSGQNIVGWIILIIFVAPIIFSLILKDPIILFFWTMLVFIVPWYFAAGTSQPEKYECTINDGVTFADFSATFEVDEQRGEIYVVHLKEKE